LEKNEFLIFSHETVSEFPRLVQAGSVADYVQALRAACCERIPCGRVCATLLDHRLQFPWDECDPGSLLFPMVRTGRQFRGKCSLRGMPKEVTRQVWALHRLCLGTFLPPSEMDDPDLHRSLSSFPPYRGHLTGKSLASIESTKGSASYLALLCDLAPGTEKQDDVTAVVAVLRGLIAALRPPARESFACILLGVD